MTSGLSSVGPPPLLMITQIFFSRRSVGSPSRNTVATPALLEKFANEFLPRIGGDNFVDGFLHGSRIPLR